MPHRMSAEEWVPGDNLTPSQWYTRERPQYTLDTRQVGRLDMMGVRQPAGAFPDPAQNNWVLQLITRADMMGAFDFGEKRFVGPTQGGHIVLSTPNTMSNYELDGDHELIVLSIPLSSTSALLRELDPRFSGHFGPLHSMLWRDNAIRDLALTIWRAGKGDAHAPDLDPDAALMKLAMMLMKRANTRFTPKELSDSLAPHARRRVVEFIEDNIDEELALFRLAEIAGLSPFHFARAFRADMGDTPHQYVTRRRLRRAEDMIKGTRLPLAEVALAAGFTSQSRTNDAFTRDIGTTPGKMRREAVA
jgi:AraC family transcriptional regulator